MAYKLEYQVQISWVGPGSGPMGTGVALPLPGGGATGQSKEFVNGLTTGPIIAGTTTFTQPNGTTISGALASGDVTNLTNAMAADIAAQMQSAATLAQLQAWVAGNP